MVQSELDSDKVDYTGINDVNSGSLGSGLRRAPSFSRWCDDGVVHLDQDLGSVEDTSVEEDCDFELPFIQKFELQNGFLDKQKLFHIKFQQTSLHLNGVSTMDEDTIHHRGNGSEKYVSFDIENEAKGGIIGVESSFSVDAHRSLEKSVTNPISIANILKALFFIIVWYTFSLLLTLYNKSLLGNDMGKFPAPFMMNTIHFAMQAVLSKLITWFWSRRFQTSVVMSWSDYFLKVVPTALATAMDVNLSNASLISISVTFATMCKSAAPIFLLLFAFAFRHHPSHLHRDITNSCKRGRVSIMGVHTCYACCSYVWLSLVYDSDSFAGLKNPFTLMSNVAPVMAVATALLSLALDPWDEFRENKYFDNSQHITQTCLLLLLGGTLAYFMVLTEYVLVSVTSAVTITIAGVVKEAITILAAVLYFHDEFTWLKGVGLLVIMVGVSLFNWYKYLKLQKGHTKEGDLAGLHTTDSAAKYQPGRDQH
ncbi:hypothetical protein Lal_00013619 [Lupinus albus]|nr:hypothetical protein Lal_00013619 [Lupinus albus]